MSKTLTVVAHFTAKPGQEQRLLDTLTAMIEPSLAEEGCLAYQPFVHPQRPGHVVMVEEWTGSDALDHHFTLPHFARVAAVLQEITTGPLSIQRLVSE